MTALRPKAIATAAAAQDAEERVTQAETRLAALQAETETKSAALEQRRTTISALLGALQRLARQPPEALIVLDAAPVDTIRTAKLMAAAVPALDSQAAALARDLGELQALRDRREREREAIALAAMNLADEREALKELIERRAALQMDNESLLQATNARLHRLSQEARDLRDLMQRLAKEQATRELVERQQAAAAAAAAAAAQPAPSANDRQIASLPPPASAKRFADAQGHVTPPVRGQVTLSFGQPGEAGQPHRGLTYETRPDAQIVAPFDGHVAYAGQFRGYGLILIIDHGEGYHTLLAGLGRIDAVAGQWVAAGEPVGAAGTPESGNPSIYVEFRRNGQPINPLPWLAARNEKVSG
ncbi:MAG TPA: peptidoglycan DD-metalloendopeptidase family protein [Stellaceae bacterium]|nr:peptidoglycan DD-metalloendopeptidase family protein [Stellaceae bacterium]